MSKESRLTKIERKNIIVENMVEDPLCYYKDLHFVLPKIKICKVDLTTIKL